MNELWSQMHLRALEEGELWGAPHGSVDRLPTRDIVHGPWPASACATVLRVWSDAEDLLDHPGRWLQGQADAQVCLYVDEGPESWEAWHDLARRSGKVAQDDAL